MQKFYYVLTALCLMCMSGNVFAAYDSKSDAKIPMSKDVKVGNMPNGMKYYILNNKKPENNAYLGFVLNAGALREDDDQNGLAHFTEHMIFNGSTNYPGNSALETLQKYGLQFGGDVNGYTYFEETSYYIKLPLDDEKLVEESFKILHDWAFNVTMNSDDIENERGIVLGEWRYRNNAESRIRDIHMPVCYKDSKYAIRNLIGDTAILKRFKPEVLRRYYKDWYRPDLMAFIAVGDFKDQAKIEKMIVNYFGKQSNPKNERPTETFEIPLNNSPRVSIATDKELQTEMVQFITRFKDIDINTYSGYAQQQKQNLVYYMLYDILKEIQDAPNDPPFFNSYAYEHRAATNTRQFSSLIQTKMGGLKRGMEAFLAAMARVRQHGFTNSEINRAKEMAINSFDNLLLKKSANTHEQYSAEILEYFMQRGSMGGIDFDVDYSKQIIKETTQQELNDIVKRYLTDDNIILLVSLPESDEATKITEDEAYNIFKENINKKVAPKAEEVAQKPLFDKKLTPGKIVKSSKDEKLGIEVIELSNGANAVLKPTKFTDNEVLFYAISKGGSTQYDEKDFFSALLANEAGTQGGIGEINKTELSKILSSKYAKLSPIISNYTEGLNGQSNKKDLETLFQLLHLYSTEPREDEAAFLANCDKMKTMLHDESESQEGAFRDSLKSIMSEHNFYSQPLTAKIVDKADYKRALEIYRERFSNANDFTYYLVGDFDLDQAKDYFKKYVATLPAGKIEKYKDRNITYPKKPVDVRFKKGVAERSFIELAIPGEIQYTPKNAMYSTALSGAIRIKLLEVIREKMGGTYAPYCYMTINKYPREEYSLNIRIIAEPKRNDEIIEACKKVLNDFATAPDDDMVNKMKETMLKQEELQQKKNDFWLYRLAFCKLNDLDYSSLLDRKELLDTINGKSIYEYAKKIINMENINIIVVSPED